MQATIRSMTSEQYHADYSAWSRSMLSTFRESKREAFLRYVEKSAPSEQPKLCMKLGSLAHTMLMEPSKVAEQFAVIPEELLASNGAFSTNRAKDFVEEKAQDGKATIKQEQFDESQRIIDSVRKVCGKWLDKATHIEQSIYWKDAVTGLMLKARPDWIVHTADGVIIFDLKTTTRIIPHTFARVIESHEYWLQECHYRQGASVAIAGSVQMFFVGIEQGWPYRCGLFQLSPESRQKSFEEWRYLVNDVATAIEKNDFSDPWEKEITTIHLKDYVFRRNA